LAILTHFSLHRNCIVILSTETGGWRHWWSGRLHFIYQAARSGSNNTYKSDKPSIKNKNENGKRLFLNKHDNDDDNVIVKTCCIIMLTDLLSVW